MVWIGAIIKMSEESYYFAQMKYRPFYSLGLVIIGCIISQITLP